MIFQEKRTLQGGQAEPKVWTVVANLRWCLLVWPVLARANGFFQLEPKSQLQWFFTTSCDQHQSAFLTSPILAEDGVCVKHLAWEHSVKTMLRSFSTTLTFNELVVVAESAFSLENARRFSRMDLVRKLAEQVGDMDFVEEVLQNEEKKGRKRKQQTGNDEEGNDAEGWDSDDNLAELLLDHMDAAEAEEFQDLKKRVTNRHAQERKRKWAQWRAEDDKAGCLASKANFAGFGSISVPHSNNRDMVSH